MFTANEKLQTANITDIMQSAYIEYSMSVIISRALPDARDGLKPVQRRILYAMLREGLLHNRSFDKCAGVVGEVLKNYHPHGDSSVYDTLVRLAQNWVMRYTLIDPQGNPLKGHHIINHASRGVSEVDGFFSMEMNAGSPTLEVRHGDQLLCQFRLDTSRGRTENNVLMIGDLRCTPDTLAESTATEQIAG